MKLLDRRLKRVRRPDLIEASRTRTVYNWLQYFSPEALEREFVECGSTVDKLYSNVARSPFDPETTEIAVVAKRI